MKVQNPIIGRARGSAGGMTFCKNYDKNVARAKAFEVSNPNTQAQQTQRDFFKQLTALCADFSDEQLRFLFPSKPKTMSRRNALSKQIAASYTIEGTEKTIDYADIDTLGNAGVMDFGETTVTAENNILSVKLADSVINKQEFEMNNICSIIVNDTKGQILLPNIVSVVSDGVIQTSLPSDWVDTDVLHAIPFILNTKDDEAYTIDFGTMHVLKRPARKND